MENGVPQVLEILLQVVHWLSFGIILAIGMLLISNLTGIGSKAEQEYQQQPENPRLLWLGMAAYAMALIGYILLVIALAQWR